MRVTYEDVKTKIPMPDVLARYGLELDKNSNIPCPIHGGDNKTGFGVHDKGMKWTCRTRDCGRASSNIDFVAKMDGISHQEAFIRLKEMFNMVDDVAPIKTNHAKPAKPKKNVVGSPILYEYRNADGSLAYHIKRVSFDDGSKKFTPIMPDGSYKCEKENRILYNLDNVMNCGEDHIFICEGEKTADALTECGYIGTTFPFGCGSWDERYLDSLRDKSIVLMPDSDEAGEKWLNEVSDSLAGNIKQSLVINIPDSFVLENTNLTGHDFADMLEVNGKDKAMLFITDELMDGAFIDKGVDRSSLNIVTDLCRKRYDELKNGFGAGIFNTGRVFGKEMAIDIMAGDVIMVIAATGVGKTRIMHTITTEYKELNFMVFDLELTPTILAQRYIAAHNKIAFKDVPVKIQNGFHVDLPTIENVFLPKHPSLTTEFIKEEVDRVEMITGRRIHCVGVDYIAKMNRFGGATESIEAHASAFKNYCSNEERVGIFTTQRSRVSPHDKPNSDYLMPSKEDALYTSAIEQSVQEAFTFCLKSEHERNILLCGCDKYTHGDKPTDVVEIGANNLVLKYIGKHVDNESSWGN